MANQATTTYKVTGGDRHTQSSERPVEHTPKDGGEQ